MLYVITDTYYDYNIIYKYVVAWLTIRRNLVEPVEMDFLLKASCSTATQVSGIMGIIYIQKLIHMCMLRRIL
jgi:hypothetical protein